MVGVSEVSKPAAAALLRETGRTAEADKMDTRAKAIRARHAKVNK